MTQPPPLVWKTDNQPVTSLSLICPTTTSSDTLWSISVINEKCQSDTNWKYSHAYTFDKQIRGNIVACGSVSRSQINTWLIMKPTEECSISTDSQLLWLSLVFVFTFTVRRNKQPTTSSVSFWSFKLDHKVKVFLLLLCFFLSLMAKLMITTKKIQTRCELIRREIQTSKISVWIHIIATFWLI